MIHFAYLDPGTGSYVFQLALAGILAGMVTMRVYWQKIKDFVRGHKPAIPQEPKPGAPAEKTDDQR